MTQQYNRRKSDRKDEDRRKDRREDRRQGKDIWLKSLTGFGLIGAIILFMSLILLSFAKPSNFTVKQKKLWELTVAWDMEFTRYIMYMMILGFIISSAGLVINSRRLKRKYDQIRLNLVFLWLVSAASLIIYFAMN